MFEDVVPCINPISSAGMVCLSPSKQLIFSIVRMDTHMSYVIEEGHLAQDVYNAGVQQTVVCEPFDRLRQFDLLLFTNKIHWDAAGEKILVPKIPTVDTMMGIKLDKETGLADESAADIITSVDDKQCSAVNLYPYDETLNVRDYKGLRVKEYQEFIKNQKAFCAFMKEFAGIGDCI